MLISVIRKFLKELSNSLILKGNPLLERSKDSFYKQNIIILDFLGKFLILVLLFFGIFSILNNHTDHGILTLSAALLMTSLLVYLKKSRNYPMAVRIIIIFCLLFTMFLFQTEISGDGLYLWTFTAPMFLIFFLKLKEGMMLAVLYYFTNMALISFNFFHTEYSFRFLVRYSGVYLTLVIMSFIYGKLQEETAKGLLNVNKKLNNTIKNLSDTEKGLSKSEEQYRALVENSNDGIGILQDFRFIYVNSKLSQMSGFDKKELLEKTLDQVLISNNKYFTERLFNKETWSGLPRERVELNLLTKSGEYIEVEVGTNTVEYEHTSSQLIFIRDVRERNLVEMEKSKISNLESFRVVANGVTHDFNNILTIIMGNLELIKYAGKDNPKIEKPLSKIEEASTRAAELMDDLYVFSTSSVIEESIEQISEIIDSVLKILKKESLSAEIIISSEDAPLELRCDRKQIAIAIKNILLNSIDATEGKSRIEISMTSFSNQAGIVNPLKRGEYLKISVKDSGKGIPLENIGKIFDPYFSTKGNVTEKGMGLGLAIANKIILDHRGLITVDSKKNIGTTFNIYLPSEIDPA